MYLSKSKYCGLWQCPKLAWLAKNKPELAQIDGSAMERFETGNRVGDLAMGLFGDFVEVTAYNGEKLDLSAMIRATKAEMEKGTPIICEASFSYNGLYCAVDILKKEPNGWAIYEVKSSVAHDGDKDDKAVYIADISYQKYVLEHCGIPVTGTYLICLNGEYVLNGELDLQKLFVIHDVASQLAAQEGLIEANIAILERLLLLEEEPEIDIHENCVKPYKCSFWNHCTAHLPSPSVFDLYRMQYRKKLELYRKGIVTFDALLESGCIKNKTQNRQILHHLFPQADQIDRTGIQAFLDGLTFPLYFLDFETMQMAIPEYQGTHPYAQIPFQYSLHYLETPEGELHHREFLGVSGDDPRRQIAQRLCQDIPANVCVLAYNKGFECTRLKELAELFPDLAPHLLAIRDHMKDLLTPFQSGCYYTKAMGGSFSIKSVLPALFPDDPALDYHNLEGIHNGGEAMAIFPKIKDMPPEEQAITRRNLLKYCELDTFAMVKVWQKLVEAAQN